MKKEETWKQKMHRQRQEEAKYNAKKRREANDYKRMGS